MALTSWKAFSFFDSSEVVFPSPDDAALLTNGDVSAICTGSDNVFFGSHDGTIRILSRAFKVVRSFKAFDGESITHMKQVDGTSLLATVAEGGSHEPQLKVWSLDKLDKKTGAPRCQSTVAIQNGRKQFPITAFAALADLSQLAFGFGNGAVTIVRGDLVHDRGTKQRTVFESEEPVTGLQFREGTVTALFIATTSRILNLVVAGKGQGQPVRTLDDKGCAVGCMTTDISNRDIIVAVDDGLYYYGLHGRGSRYNCDGQKTLVTSHKDYVAVVSPSSTNSFSKATIGAISGGLSSATPKMFTFLILNTDFQYVAHAENLSSSVKQCFAEWGDLFVLTEDSKLLRYREKPLQQRLDILFQSKLFVLAIQMAQKAGLDVAGQNVIFRRYGDYLYQKRDYDTAMQQYLRAIDNTEPSEVIRKYLDTQRINNLVAYLEELHEHRKATSDHTILLLNCYAKLRDVGKLEAFIKAPGELRFEADAAISMCRQGGYFDQAAYLARKHSDHDLVVSILVEDSKKYAEAMAYIWRLEPESAYRNFSKYATVLLEHCPDEATQIFIDYYTGQFRPKKDAVVVTAAPTSQSTNFAASAVQNLASLLPLPHMSVDSGERPGSSDQKTQAHVVESQSNEPPPEYSIPRPRHAFSAFLDHNDEFVKFLEACVSTNNLAEDDKSDVYTALFETYLRTARENTGDEKVEWENRARKLIDSKDIPLDTLNVLLLSDLERFRDGTILVREQQGLRFEIFRSYTSANDTSGAIKALRKYGPEEPQLYPAALAYFTSSSRILEEAGTEFDAVLRKIDDDGLMAPLQVIQTLSANSVATMGLVKRYLQNTIGRERDEITKNRKMISTFRTDSESKKAELERLSTEAQTLKATRCASCGYALDQPSVHYMCEHSFHQWCLNIPEGEAVESVECPKCAPQNADIREFKKAQERSKERHDLFKEQLGRSRDRFGTVAEWFGRGVMAAPGGDLA